MRTRRGFSLPELLLALTIGMVVIVAGTDFAVRTFKSRRGWMVREGVDRNARYLGMSLQRDAASAGVALESGASFASVNARGDTLSFLYAPRILQPGGDSIEAPVYALYDDGGAGATYPPGGNCGATCLEFNLGGQTLNQILYPALFQLRVGTVRRLLLVTGGDLASFRGQRFRVTFLDVPELLGRPSGLDGVLLQRAGTSLQEVKAVAYWRDAATNQLMRTERLTERSLAGAAVARDVEAFTARLRFTDGDNAATYDAADADSTNDGNDIIGLTVRARVQANRTDATVNGGVRLARWYEWRMSPRNLLYERNRQ